MSCPNECTELINITQKREGNTVYLYITTKRPKDTIAKMLAERHAS